MSGLAEEELEQSLATIWAKRGGAALLLALMLLGVVHLARELAAPAATQQKQMAKIRIVPETPPPPPPPKEEKKPEPPKEVKENRVEPPKEQPPQPQEAQPLKMEGQGSDTGLAGLQAGAVQNDYIGQKLGDGGNRFSSYLGMLQQELNRALQKVDQLRTADYRVVVRVWVGADGSVSRAELAGSTGNADIDERLRQALAVVPPLRERPPDGMPQPVRLRLTSR